nr:hypothetical protein [Rhizobium leguminosarum]
MAAVVAPIAVVNSLMSPIAGALTDRLGPRRVLALSSISMAFGLTGVGIASQNSPTYSCFFRAVA